MVREYTTTFLNVAEDAYHRRVKMEAIISFLGALRGLGAICHILVKGTVDRLEDGPFKDSITCSMDVDTQEFDKKVNNLKDKFMAANIYAYKVVADILFNGILQAQLYVSKLVECRKAALPHIKGERKYFLCSLLLLFARIAIECSCNNQYISLLIRYLPLATV
ncbi:hypothetical protein GQ55_5G189600 [Panicum hallii var. hallii]|uniref:Uncharacterized protein n=1 Tax=Panicum hallii var. hallii TaxID=1504633 RepID=A0A2T7DHX3_9POAL|nr:hypothetical protein GQ55_5G189600 [Panicum hallii var. hallii]